MRTLLTSIRRIAVLGTVALGLIGTAKAVPVVSLDPVTQTIDVGDTAVVQLNISGLGTGVAPSVGSWLSYINYNSAVVSINAANVAFGTNLDLGTFGSLQFADSSTGGIIKADETSFEDTAALNASQPAAFRLATFTFTAVAPGVSPLTFNRLELGDAEGFTLQHSATTASITVRGATAVPDSGGVLLSLTCCLIGLAVVDLRRRLANQV
jgi:hypothetical protein